MATILCWYCYALNLCVIEAQDTPALGFKVHSATHFWNKITVKNKCLFFCSIRSFCGNDKHGGLIGMQAFTRKLWSFRVCSKMQDIFFKSGMESAISSSIICRGRRVRAKDLKRLVLEMMVQRLFLKIKNITNIIYFPSGINQVFFN